MLKTEIIVILSCCVVYVMIVVDAINRHKKK